MSDAEKPNVPFVRNAWCQAAWSNEIADGILARTIMNQPLVLFRGPDGKAAALEDRCCHRGAPLTLGTVVDKGLMCNYHGLVFDGSGKCVDIPGQKNIPDHARVRSFPVVERQQFVWIWMGDPALADESQIIDYPYNDLTDEWPHVKDMIPLKCNYMMMIDNLMDLTHLGYLHTKTIGGNPLAHVGAEMDTVKTERGVKFTRWMLDVLPPPTYVKGGGFKGKVDRWQEFEYVMPSAVLQWSGALDVGKGAVENREQDGFHFRLIHSITPETDTTCFYFWTASTGKCQIDSLPLEQVYNEVYPTFLEDKEMLDRQQARIDLDPSRPLVSIRADGNLTLARRALQRMLDAEAGVSQAAE